MNLIKIIAEQAVLSFHMKMASDRIITFFSSSNIRRYIRLVSELSSAMWRLTTGLTVLTEL